MAIVLLSGIGDYDGGTAANLSLHRKFARKWTTATDSALS